MPRKKHFNRRDHAASGRLPSRASQLRLVEMLEERVLLSAVATRIKAEPTFVVSAQISAPAVSAQPDATLAAPFAPSQIVGAYGVNAVALKGGAPGNGAGQTIAIIDAYNDPDIVSDTATFDTQWELPQFNDPKTPGGPTLQVLNQKGQSSKLPSNASPGGWDIEESLDVEWAHSIAPDANIILMEANSSSLSDLLTAVTKASSISGVSVVSMSWSASDSSGEQAFDSNFTTSGVTYLASTGDSGEPAGYPAYSPNVVAVGGTSLTINSDGSWGGETGWSDSGGGISGYESQPPYQRGNVNGTSATFRTAPDVSAVADPNTGVYVYDSYYGGWYEVGGTSLATPVWAAMIAIANQGRALNGLGTLNGATTQTLQAIYNLPSGDFHDIVSGNNGYAAGTGYDLVTGRGSPIANLLIPDLANVPSNSSTKLAFGAQPPNGTTGVALSPAVTVDLENSGGGIVSTDNSFVTLSLASGSGTLSGTLTVEAINGVATFNNLSLSAAGSFTLAASDGGLTSATSNSFTISPPVQPHAQVAGEYIFYNDSAYDGNDPTANMAATSGNSLTDFSAIATDKTALLPGQSATFANYTSYSRGINGILIDFTSLAAGTTLKVGDFQFLVGNVSDNSQWTTAPAPVSITMGTDPANGDAAADLIWADNAIQNEWLQVTVLVDGNTNLTAPSTFYFGNAIGETGNDSSNAQVDSADVLGARNAYSGLGTVPITNDFDFNRDGRVDAQDVLIARNGYSGLSSLQLIQAPASAPSADELTQQSPADSLQPSGDEVASTVDNSSGSQTSSVIASPPSMALATPTPNNYSSASNSVTTIILHGKLRRI